MTRVAAIAPELMPMNRLTSARTSLRSRVQPKTIPLRATAVVQWLAIVVQLVTSCAEKSLTRQEGQHLQVETGQEIDRLKLSVERRWTADLSP